MRKISNGLVCENGNQPGFFYVLVGVAVVAVVEPPYCLSSLVTLRQIRKKIVKFSQTKWNARPPDHYQSTCSTTQNYSRLVGAKDISEGSRNKPLPG